MLKIRLSRGGSRQAPIYRVVVSDSQKRPTGRNVETLGLYDPGTEPATIRLDVARAEAWIAKGAQVSDTVRSLIEKAKVAPVGA